MKENLCLLDLFSGIGGFALGLKKAGFKFSTHYFSEIDKHAMACYKNNFKKAEYVGAVETISRRKSLKRPDIVTFGSPCQDFSVAGNQKGLAGERSSLIREAIKIIDAFRPSVFIWENVKGVFSTNSGADFWAVISAFTNIGGYRLEWQLLNTSWVLPQNRERIYLVGHLAGRSKSEVFPFREDDQMPSTKNTTKQDRLQTKNSTTITTRTGRRPTDTFVASPILTPFKIKTRQNGRRSKEAGENAFTITAQDRHGVIIDKYTSNSKIKCVNYSKSQQNRLYNPLGDMCCITSSRTSNKINILINTSIRRLTEIECERLQGFPDDWTKYGDYEEQIKEISETQRYKLIGNAVTTDIVKIIGNRLFLT